MVCIYSTCIKHFSCALFYRDTGILTVNNKCAVWLLFWNPASHCHQNEVYYCLVLSFN